MQISLIIMKKQLIAAVCCVCALFAGCEQAEELDSMGGKLEMSMLASIEGSDNSGASRYAGDAPNSVAFTKGDAIGMAVGEGEFVKWVYNTAWKPEGASVNWNDKTSNHNFRAFYPYADNASKGSVPMPELANQTGEMTCVAEKDFLVASKTQTYGTNGEVLFTGDDAFKHVSSLVALTLKAEGELTSATINEISIEGTDILTPTTYSFDVDKVTLDSDNSKKIDLLKLNPSHSMDSNNKNFYFVLNSGTVDLSAVTLKIDYTTSKGSYIAELKGLGTNEVHKFERGKQYSYSLKVAGGELVISGNEIQDWGEGLILNDIVINGTQQQD